MVGTICGDLSHGNTLFIAFLSVCLSRQPSNSIEMHLSCAITHSGTKYRKTFSPLLRKPTTCFVLRTLKSTVFSDAPILTCNNCRNMITIPTTNNIWRIDSRIEILACRILRMQGKTSRQQWKLHHLLFLWYIMIYNYNGILQRSGSCHKTNTTNYRIWSFPVNDIFWWTADSTLGERRIYFEPPLLSIGPLLYIPPVL